ncbi:ABC transporter permease [Ruminiclostridium cellobioparum]|uniref:ABC-type multidrug transport system, permease component n=1 Tax=Ruminiclostridium cellobioparum subsp. termitidis CT1112 TaxID=1195236 RepID=S0FID0_RUMCE|nr:ABC transporter permease [Ruminiclostridium cellobioparum]EMS71725.1 ABC-type multidrug transport system, permease component [Ruminiclostridium cellobioparum subsp. termitidis CT1112]
MRNMFIILKNNFYRAVSRKNYFILMLCISIITITAAVFFTAKLEVKGNIAVVSDTGSLYLSSKLLHVEKVDRVPDRASLVMHKYDAAVIDRGDGEFEIQTIRSDDFKKKLEKIIKNQDLSSFKDENSRGVASNILGYMIMIVFIQGLLYMLMYSEDRENGTFKRIGVSPVPAGVYLAGHGIFNFLMVFLPTYLLIISVKIIFGINIGLSFIQYAGILGLLTFLATGFSLFISSLFKKADSSNMAGQSIAVLTSLLAGCFYSFDNGNEVMKKIISILPQKNLISLVQAIEHGKSFNALVPQLTYMIAFSAVLFVLAAAIVKINFKKGEC